MDIHIIYHILAYTVVFIPLSLFLKGRLSLLLSLLILPIAGELVQLVLAKSFPNIPYFWFSFELIDIGTNTIGGLIGIGIGCLIASVD